MAGNYERTPEIRAKMSAALKGYKKSPEHIAKIAAANTGIKRGPHSAEHRAKIGDAQKGKVISPEQRAKISAAVVGKDRKEIVDYHGMHTRLVARRGTPRLCEACGSTDRTGPHAYEWAFRPEARATALISEAKQSLGYPYSLNLDDYISMCVPCHATMDKAAIAGKIVSFKQFVIMSVLGEEAIAPILEMTG